MSKRTKTILIVLGSLFLLAILVYQIPRVKSAVSWRLEKYTIYAKNVIDPPGPVPTALPVTPAPPTATPPVQVQITPTVTPLPATPTATSAPLPAQASLPSPPYEQQTPNNCGPATLSMALHIYGWEGSQEDIAAQVKPVLQDRNVNPEELAYYVRNFAGWLNIQYRVDGDLTTLKRLLAARYPVMVEGVTELDPNDALGPNDDLWAAHYLLLTGYDDATQAFTVQDSYHGANRTVSYDQLQSEWEPFNNLYMVIYFPQNEAELQSLLGADWDADANRQRALDEAQAATVADPNDAFAWFNLGSDLVYFERYDEAAQAYAKSSKSARCPCVCSATSSARSLGVLPRRPHRRPVGADRICAWYHRYVRRNLALVRLGALPKERFQGRQSRLAESPLHQRFPLCGRS